MSFYPDREDDMDLGLMPLPLPGVGSPVFQLRNAHYDPHAHLPVSAPGAGVSGIGWVLTFARPGRRLPRARQGNRLMFLR